MTSFLFWLKNQKLLVSLFLLGIVSRLSFLLYSNSKVFSFAPDERTHAYFADWAAKSLSMDEVDYYFPSVYNTRRALIMPASQLIRFGIEPLFAVRIISTLYAIASLALFLYMIFIISSHFSKKLIQDSNSLLPKYGIPTLFATFTFLPSHFLWGNLGLRESASDFYQLAILSLTLKLMQKLETGNYRNWNLLIVGLCLSLLAGIAMTSRREVLLLFICSIIFSLALTLRVDKLLFVTPFLALGIFLGFNFSATPEVNLVSESVVLSIDRNLLPAEIDLDNLSKARIILDSTGRSGEVGNGEVGNGEVGNGEVGNGEVGNGEVGNGTSNTDIQNKNSAELFETIQNTIEWNNEKDVIVGVNDETLKSLESKGDDCTSDKSDLENNFCLTVELKKNQSNRSAQLEAFQTISALSNIEKQSLENSYGANSVILNKCALQVYDLKTRIRCNIQQLPIRILALLIRPFPGFDELTNSSLIYAGLENIFWALFFSIIIYLALSSLKRVRLRDLKYFGFVTPTVYALGFITLVSLWQGNYGSAFRHKSSILWALLLMIFSLAMYRNESKHRNQNN